MGEAKAILELAVSIATPLSLTGFVFGILYLIYSQVLRQRLAPLVARHTFIILNNVIRYLFQLAMVALVLGLLIHLVVTLCGMSTYCGAKPDGDVRLEVEVQQHLAMKHYQDALQASERLIALSPRNAKAYRLKGIALYMLSRYPEALQAYDTALKLAPESQETLFDKGAALLKIRDYERAQAAYEKLLALNSGDFATRFNLAEVKLYRRDYAAAKSDYQIVYDSDVTHRPGSALGLGIIRVFTTANLNEGVTQALPYFRRAICLEPKLRGVFFDEFVEVTSQDFDTYREFLNELRRKNSPVYNRFLTDVHEGRGAC